MRVESHGPITFVRLARGVLGRPLFWTGCYYVEGVLLDCGPPATARELLSFLEGRRVDALLITHHHEDHMGTAPQVQARFGATALVHPAGVPLVERGYVQEAYRQVVWGRHPLARARPLAETFEVAGLHFEVVHTPGHSLDHVCFFEPERGWLFTGDLFLAERLRYLRSDEDLMLLIESLERVVRLPATSVFCAHRGPVPDGLGALRRKADVLRTLRGAILDGLARGLSQREIARRCVGREGFLSWFSLGRFSALNFVKAVVSELGGAAPHPPDPPLSPPE